jgi:hypothetical protein
MKVLHVYPGNLFGGIETLLVTLAKEQGLCAQIQHHGRLANKLYSLDTPFYL